MRSFLGLVAAGMFVLVTAAPASADVQLTIQNGRVTLVAKDATLRQILTEWARVGQTKVVNVERVPGGPMTVDMRDVPEQQALKQLLRSISGYVAAPRLTVVANGSVFDRIIVMPTTVSAAAGSASSAAQPTFTPAPPIAMPQVTEDDTDDGPTRVPQQPGNRGPVFVFPQPQSPNPQQPFQPPQAFQPAAVAGQPMQPGAVATPAPTSAYPGAPTSAVPSGVSVPGMVVPTPQPPPQPGQPGQPVPIRLPRSQ